MTIRITTAFKSSVSNVFACLHVFLFGHFTTRRQTILTHTIANNYVANICYPRVPFSGILLNRYTKLISRFVRAQFSWDWENTEYSSHI